MNNKIYDLYKKGLEIYLDKVIDFSIYDEKVKNSNLYFSESNSINKNLSSKFYGLLNEIYIENLNEDYIKIIENKNIVDEELLDIVSKTYKEVLTKKGVKNIMYNPPMPSHFVLNGSLVLEFVYGKNSAKFREEDYAKLVKLQRDFINKMNNEICLEIETKLNIKCTVFVEKRV